MVCYRAGGEQPAVPQRRAPAEGQRPAAQAGLVAVALLHPLTTSRPSAPRTITLNAFFSSYQHSEANEFG